MIERKFDLHVTRNFQRHLNHVGVSEFEREIIIQSMLQFCASLDRSRFAVMDVDDLHMYEFQIPVLFRQFIVTFEVDGIDAYALRFEEIVG